jgi:hypothetical protein
MGVAAFNIVAAGDGSPQRLSGYRVLVLHAIATVLLLLAVVAALWEFMDWVATPSCPPGAAVPTVSSPTVAARAGQPAMGSPAPTDGECPCPQYR